MNRILIYHSIGAHSQAEVGAGLYCVSADNFRKQMEYISKVIKSKERREENIIVTFDDGLVDNYTSAYPILKELGIQAYFFILVSKIGTEGYMRWEQIKELHDNGMTVGSHGMTHRILTELNDRDLDYELKESKKILEQRLGLTIDYLSIPRGFYHQKVIQKAKEVGYKAIFTSDSKDNADFKIGRIPVKGNWDLTYFTRVLNGGVSLKDKTGQWLKNRSKKILGAKVYDILRTSLLTK